MKIAIFSESPTDEASLKILIEGILGEKIEEIPYPNHLRSRGSGVPSDFPFVLRSVYYNTEAEFLVVVRDSDDSPIHKKEHDEPNNKEAEKCRLCDLRKKVKSALENLTPMQGKEMLKVAIGVPVPAIEAWLLFGKNPQVSENTWIRKQNGEKITYDRKKLKSELYGGDHVPQEKRIEISRTAIQRIIENELLEGLEKDFPQGFGKMADEVRLWK